MRVWLLGLLALLLAGTASAQDTGNVFFTGTGTTGHIPKISGASGHLTVDGGTPGPVYTVGCSSFTVFPLTYTTPCAGTGSGADQTAINNAITAASNAGGGTVVLMAGTYYVASGVSCASNVVLKGSGRGATIIELDNSVKDNVININDCSHAAVEDLTTNGNYANQTYTSGDSDAKGNGIRIDGSPYTYIHNVEVIGSYAHGIFLNDSGTYSGTYPNGSIDSDISEIWSHGNGQIGLHAHNNSSSIATIHGVHFSHIHDYGNSVLTSVPYAGGLRQYGGVYVDYTGDAHFVITDIDAHDEPGPCFQARGYSSSSGYTVSQYNVIANVTVNNCGTDDQMTVALSGSETVGGTINLVFTSSGITGSPVTVGTTVTNGESLANEAIAIATAINANSAVTNAGCFAQSNSTNAYVYCPGVSPVVTYTTNNAGGATTAVSLAAINSDGVNIGNGIVNTQFNNITSTNNLAGACLGLYPNSLNTTDLTFVNFIGMGCGSSTVTAAGKTGSNSGVYASGQSTYLSRVKFIGGQLSNNQGYGWYGGTIGNGVSVDDMIIYNNGGYGIRVVTGGVNFAALNNHVELNLLGGINLSGASAPSKIVGNTLIDDTASSSGNTHEIIVTSTSPSALIANNTMIASARTNSGFPVEVDSGSTNATITGNSATNSGASVSFYTNAAGTIITNNYGNGTNAVRFDSSSSGGQASGNGSAYVNTGTNNKIVLQDPHQYTAATSGTVSAGVGQDQMFQHNTGTTTSLTVQPPGYPSYGETWCFSSDHAVTTLTVSVANSSYDGGTVTIENALTAFAPATTATQVGQPCWVYDHTATEWMRLQ